MMENIIGTSPEKCTGCAACAAVCGAGAISMRINGAGFYEPHIDYDLCVKCGKCRNTCPVTKECKKERIASYYGHNRNKDVLYNSTSGGAFAALANNIISRNGAVWGAVYSDDFSEVLFGCSDDVNADKMQKSKYIVSNTGDALKKIKKQLEEGRTVLFSGAPCQAAGCICSLGREYDNLITVDFVCGGMPSLAFWQEHKENLERKHNSKIIGVDFRSKKNGWGKGYFEVHFENGKEYFTRDYLDSYYHCFCDEHISVRRSCLECKFRDKHFADITIADFWGYRQTGISEVSEGVSLLISNSRKGDELIGQLEGFEGTLMDNRYSDYALKKSSPSDEDIKKHTAFFKIAQEAGFEKAARKMCPATNFEHLKKYIKLRLGKI